ncbi:MAG: 30S ribosomal protein S6 [Myxococcales bacterium]|jgi:small subunit ribosomal protein S6|nr:30S ribosomal protein S6 [Myxococcales bacterium]
MQTQYVKSKEYETIYILRSDVDADTADKVQGRVAEVIGRDAGKLVKVEQWGRRKLAYPVGKQKRGVYVYVKYVGRGPLVHEVERNLKLQDAVLKWQTVVTADGVDIAEVAVDPEEIKFQRLELGADTEAEESREKQLGLVDMGPDAPKRAREDEFGDEEAEEEEPAPSIAPAAAAAAAAKKEDEEA